MRKLLLMVMFLLMMVRTAAADFVVVGASHDATIYSGNSNNSNGAGPGMFVGADGTPQMLRSLVQFDVAGAVPAGSTITGVQLTLYLGAVAGSGASADSGNRTIELHRLLASWGEGPTESTATGIGGTGQGAAAGTGDATWSDRFWSSTTPTAWSNPGGDFAATSGSASVGTSVNTAYTWLSTASMVSDVQGWLNYPSTNDGWLLRNSDEAVAKTYRAFWTREASNASLRPQLQITYTAVPEPGAISVVAAVALGLARRRGPR